MHPMIRPAGLLLLSGVLGSGPAPARAADPAAVATLKTMGLTRSGRTLVIEAEGPALAKMKEARSAQAAYTTVAERRAAAEQIASHLSQLEERRAELQARLDDLNQRINEQGTLQAAASPRPGPGGPARGSMIPEMIARRDQIKATLAEVTLEQKSLNGQATPAQFQSQAQSQTAPDEDLKKKAEAFKAALAEVRPLVDEVTKKYAALGADPAVKAAINGLETATKVDLKLGPSDAFLSGVKALD